VYAIPLLFHSVTRGLTSTVRTARALPAYTLRRRCCDAETAGLLHFCCASRHAACNAPLQPASRRRCLASRHINAARNFPGCRSGRRRLLSRCRSSSRYHLASAGCQRCGFIAIPHLPWRMFLRITLRLQRDRAAGGGDIASHCQTAPLRATILQQTSRACDSYLLICRVYGTCLTRTVATGSRHS